MEWTEAFRLDGTGDEAVVLIHGFTGHPGHWLPMSEILVGEGYTVVAPLLAGHGTTTREVSRSTWMEWVDSARAATESVADHRRVHLVGLSMGGLIAILLARTTAAATLTTINAPVLLREAKAYLAPLARHLTPFVPSLPEEVPDPDLAHLWVEEERRSTAAADQLLRVMWHAWWQAGRLRRPSLVIQSGADETVWPLSGRLLARRLRADVLRIDTRHNALLDPQREVVGRAVLEHLEAATRPQGMVRRH